MTSQRLVALVFCLLILESFADPLASQIIDGGMDRSKIPLPPSYSQRVQEDPDFFRIHGGWVQKTHSAVLRGSPLSGVLPVVLIQGLFSDSPEPHVSREDLQASLFDGPAEYGTLTEFYEEASGGRLTVTGEAFPWVRTSLTMSQVVGDSYGLGSGSETGAFLFEMVAGVDGMVDFGQFDNDGPDGVPNSGDDDGTVDAVAFQFLEVSASCGGPGIWPHRSRLQNWNAGEPFVSDDGAANGGFIIVNDYTIQSAVDCGGVEVQKATTIAHELGHVLGLPDLYDRSQGLEPEYRRWVVGCWDLMAAGSWGCGTMNREEWVRPTHIGAWEKDRLGWLGSLELVGDVLDEEYVLEPVQGGEQVLKIPLESGPLSGDTEYLLLEYRTKEGFDQDLPASGVLVYHVDPKISGNRPCDTCPQQYRVVLLEADGNDSLLRSFLQGGNRGEAGDAWGVVGPGMLTNHTYPSTRLTNGSSSPVAIHEIALEGGVARITVSTHEFPRSNLARPLLGGSGPSLSSLEAEHLDKYGNRNGEYDVGDLRAHLRR
ncbi:MAG: M6 family metalloprotease domain-containing protein [Gemmatimonadetes bacterium]|nr:M6 family metalloprotease domain-containing protein [Gemmatimonadota bacterium]